MSTIEEAREQAREALANHAVNIMETDYWCDVVLAPALRALLDATEPPTCSCQQVQECYDDGSWARSHVVVPDPECEAHTPTEPPETFGQCDECGFYACSCLTSSQADKPAEDEREALTTLISATTYQAAWGECVRAADAILAAGYSKGPRPITDEMVEAAAREYHERGNGEGSFARMSGHVRTSLLFRMKCALRAAEEARR